jgi:hypothetical protein
VQFSLLPSTTNTTLRWVAAVFAGLVIAGAVLLVLLLVRRSRAPAG